MTLRKANDATRTFVSGLPISIPAMVLGAILVAVTFSPALAQERNVIAVVRVVRQGLAVQDRTEALFLVGADDESVTRIYRADALLLRGSWSPDGTQLVFTRADNGGLNGCHIVVVDSDGSNPHSIRDLAFPACLFYPSWSPDGSTILIQDNLNIFTMRPNGSYYRQLTHFTQQRSFLEGIAWSPDGHRVAFARDAVHGGGRLFVMRADGSDTHKIRGCSSRLCRSGLRTANPAWSPNGHRIAFEEERNIFWTGPGGTYVHRLSRCPRTLEAQTCSAFSPTWSPNSNRLAFQSGGRLRIVDIKTRWMRTLALSHVSFGFWRT